MTTADDPFKPTAEFGTSKASKTQTRTRTAKPKVSATDINALREPLEDIYGTIAVITSMRSPNVGLVIGEQTEKCVDAWIDLARQNASVARMLQRLTTGSSVTALAAAHFPIALAVIQSRSDSRVDLSDADESETVSNVSDIFSRVP